MCTVSVSGSTSKEAHRFEISLVLWNPAFLSPRVHLEIGNDMRPGRLGSLFAPAPPNLLDPGLVVAEFPVPHPVRRFPGKFIQPAVDLLEGFAKQADGFLAMLLKGWHCRTAPIYQTCNQWLLS